MTDLERPILICDGTAGAHSVLYANPALAARAGQAADRVVGGSVAAVLAALGVSDSVLLQQPPTAGSAPAANGELMQFSPMPPGNRAAAAWILQLVEQGAAADDFVDRLPIGTVLFDADDRLVWFNETYRGIIGPNAHLLRLGDTFDTIMTAAYRTGRYGGAGEDIEQLIAVRRARHFNHETFEEPLTDGRCLLTREIALGNGGILGVRTDITAQKRART